MHRSQRRLVLFTSQDIGYQLVRYFSERPEFELLVVTRRPVRDRIYGYRSALDFCVENDIRVLESEAVQEDVAEQVAAWQPEMIVSAYYPKMIPKEVLSLPPRGCINIHPGILPHYRGRYPTPWYILNGEEYFGLAIHRLEEGVDSGPVFVQEKYPVHVGETGHELYRRTMDLGFALLKRHFDAIFSGEIRPKPQSEGGSYYRSIEKRYQIDWNLSREYIARRVRVHAMPYFPAFTFLFNRILLVNQVSFIDPAGYSAQGGGKILEVWPDDRLIVTCSDGCLLIEDYEVCPQLQPEDKALHLKQGVFFD